VDYVTGRPARAEGADAACAAYNPEEARIGGLVPTPEYVNCVEAWLFFPIPPLPF
jgi:hypothetical protein